MKASSARLLRTTTKHIRETWRAAIVPGPAVSSATGCQFVAASHQPLAACRRGVWTASGLLHRPWWNSIAKCVIKRHFMAEGPVPAEFIKRHFEVPLYPAEFIKQHLEASVDTAVIDADLKILRHCASHGFRDTIKAGLDHLSLRRDARPKVADPPPKHSFQAFGDPEIIVRNEEGNVIKRHYYRGPAVILFFDEKGDLKHIDFVGVTNFFGFRRQSPNSYFVGEHVRLYVHTGEWRYRDATWWQTAEVSECDWASQKHADWQPDVEWLQPFMSGKTFVLHSFQPRIIEGPHFESIWRMAVAPELNNLDFDRSKAREWMNAILCVVGSAQLNGMKDKAEELLKYAIVYGLAMANGGQQLAAHGGR